MSSFGMGPTLRTQLESADSTKRPPKDKKKKKGGDEEDKMSDNEG